MDGFVSVGFGNYINLSGVTAITRCESAPMKRLVQNAKDHAKAVDVTQGRKTKAVILMNDGSVVLSALLPETIVSRTRSASNPNDQIMQTDT
ncbi:MAG: DUF370 domain-containing protein [Lachnospiraceae bacterium]|nr:DUF370 domain-containing protein [Lachnospiraceae bacterium]